MGIDKLSGPWKHIVMVITISLVISLASFVYIFLKHCDFESIPTCLVWELEAFFEMFVKSTLIAIFLYAGNCLYEFLMKER